MLFVGMTFPVFAQEGSADDFGQAFEFMGAMGIAVAPMVIILVLTEIVKKLFIKNRDGTTTIVQPWASIILFGSTVIFSIGITLIFSFPGFTWLTYIQDVLKNAAYAAFGYNALKSFITKAGT